MDEQDKSVPGSRRKIKEGDPRVFKTLSAVALLQKSGLERRLLCLDCSKIRNRFMNP